VSYYHAFRVLLFLYVSLLVSFSFMAFVAVLLVPDRHNGTSIIDIFKKNSEEFKFIILVNFLKNRSHLHDIVLEVHLVR